MKTDAACSMLCGMKHGRARTQDEWICGVINTGAWVVEPDDRATLKLVIVWMRASGELLGLHGIQANEFPEAAAATFDELVSGQKHHAHPTRVRVHFYELADRLRQALPKVDVVCAATPELERFRARIELELSRAQFSSNRLTKSVLQVPAFYKSAAALWKIAPWAWLPHGTILKVSAPDFGLPYAGAVFAGGRDGDEPGFLLFNSVRSAERFVELLERYRTTRSEQLKREIPAHVMLGYVCPPERLPIPDQLLETARKMGWDLDLDSIFPWHVGYGPGLDRKPATPSEVWLVEVVQFAFQCLLTGVEDPSVIGDVFANGFVLQAYGGQTGRVEVALPLDAALEAHHRGGPLNPRLPN